ncbi:drug/metabolite transporter (DMT)-like permease [Actinoalloteichus hoggarensis]|uniref:EamA-like transporter family protein n=1 Tax=Actinoalloteichus hoggarensis TaxID=1470176 RepID=A0A221VY69_9PSEU|nr:DMT family transporter [Actinoalloteichus hoggarensis]ASO18437.1 EamA-like transporter family protein [Actinoalloteichus hoggarensis]MBB5921804.1 drug/metabolite transporter (DMT)-like permease [Actinoalloteichus hoggarensis]
MTSGMPSFPARGQSPSPGVAIAAGLAGIVLVGGSVPVTGLLDDYPLFAAQSLRYLIGAACLSGWLLSRERVSAGRQAAEGTTARRVAAGPRNHGPSSRRPRRWSWRPRTPASRSPSPRVPDVRESDDGPPSTVRLRPAGPSSGRAPSVGPPSGASASPEPPHVAPVRGPGRRTAGLPIPGLRDLLALTAVAATGMVGFSILVLLAQRHADPGLVAAVVGAAPLLIGVLAPLAAGSRPGGRVVLGAVLVVAGAAVLSGGGSWQGPGLLLAGLALVGEASFTLLAAGPVRRLGAMATAAYACLLAGVGAGLVSVVVEGPSTWRIPEVTETAALLVLGVLVTAVAFACWFHCVSIVGADRASLLIGAMPVAGLTAAVLLGMQGLTAAAVLGACLVAVGCVLGLGARRPGHRTGRRPGAGAAPIRAEADSASED